MTGIDLYDLTIAGALGLAELPRAPGPERWGAAIRFFEGPPGRLLSVTGAHGIKSRPDIHRVLIEAEPGQLVGAARDSFSRLGAVIALGATPGEAIAKAEAAVDQLVPRVKVV